MSEMTFKFDEMDLRSKLSAKLISKDTKELEYNFEEVAKHGGAKKCTTIFGGQA